MLVVRLITMVQLILQFQDGNVAGNANYTYVWSTTDGSGLIQGGTTNLGWVQEQVHWFLL